MFIFSISIGILSSAGNSLVSDYWCVNVSNASVKFHQKQSPYDYFQSMKCSFFQALCILYNSILGL